MTDTQHGHQSNVVVAENPDEQKAATNEPALKFEVEEFIDGDYKGFKYTVPVYNITGRKVTMDVDEGIVEAVKHFGESTSLSLFNSQVLSRIRTKVKNGVPKGLKPNELAEKQKELLLKHPDGILFDENDATTWKPDVRELSPNQLFKKAKEAFNNASKESDMAKKMEFMAMGQKFLLQMGEALAA